MTVFSAAIDAIFADPNMAADAVWLSGGSAANLPCRIVTRRPDEVVDYGLSSILTPTILVDIRVSEVPDLAKGDQLVWAGETYTVTAQPRRDRDRLIWIVELVPAT